MPKMEFNLYNFFYGKRCIGYVIKHFDNNYVVVCMGMEIWIALREQNRKFPFQQIKTKLSLLTYWFKQELKQKWLLPILTLVLSGMGC